MAPSSAGAVEDKEFAGLMGRVGPFPENPRLAVAVSGGPDSLALTVLADRWATQRSGRLLAYTVDHGLRPDSADEANRVQMRLQERGIDHRVLPWQRGVDEAAGQSAARDARYRLMADACRRDGVIHLLLGHHRDDQIETLLLRLERQSGPLGLAAMKPITVRRGLRLLRPFLTLGKDRLVQTCREAAVSPALDPTNLNEHYDRPGLRRLLAGQEGTVVSALASAGGRAGAVAAKIDDLADGLQKAAIRFRPQGYAWLDRRALRGASPLIVNHMLSRLLQCLAGGDYLRGQSIDGVADWLREDGGGKRGHTVGLVYVRHGRDGEGRPGVLFCREASKLPEIPVAQASSIIWDQRLSLDLKGLPSRQGTLAAIGETKAQVFKKIWNCPPEVAATLPALWQDGEIVALPQFSFHDRVEFAGNLASFDCLWHPRRSITQNVVDRAGAQLVDKAPVV